MKPNNSAEKNKTGGDTDATDTTDSVDSGSTTAANGDTSDPAPTRPPESTLESSTDSFSIPSPKPRPIATPANDNDHDPGLYGDSEGSVKYELHAVVVHAGVGLGSGHFYAFGKQSHRHPGASQASEGSENKAEAAVWMRLDDARVAPMSFTEMNERLRKSACDSAYLLVYHRAPEPSHKATHSDPSPSHSRLPSVAAEWKQTLPKAAAGGHETADLKAQSIGAATRDSSVALSSLRSASSSPPPPPPLSRGKGSESVSIGALQQLWRDNEKFAREVETISTIPVLPPNGGIAETQKKKEKVVLGSLDKLRETKRASVGLDMSQLRIDSSSDDYFTLSDPSSSSLSLSPSPSLLPLSPIPPWPVFWKERKMIFGGKNPNPENAGAGGKVRLDRLVCGVCTLENPVSAKMCNVCGASLQKALAKLQAYEQVLARERERDEARLKLLEAEKQIALAEMKLTCSMCTYANKWDALTCEVTHTTHINPQLHPIRIP